MKLTVAVLCVVAVGSCSNEHKQQSGDGATETVLERADANGCRGPIAAVLKTLKCIQSEDVECSLAGYNPQFKKLHNGIDTGTSVSAAYWAFAFKMVDLHIDINHSYVIENSTVSLRYIETVSFSDGEILKQHEHALITVDDECRMLLWDQYGDNEEQAAVERHAFGR